MARQHHPFSEILLFLFIISSMFTNIVLAQGFDVVPTGDVIAPAIEHEVSIHPVIAGEPLIIEAGISDTSGVEEVILFYRRDGDSKYKRLQMQWTGGSRYQATIPPQEVAEPGIQYYLRATDTAGNAALRGLAFSLLQIKVVPGEAAEPVVGPPMMAVQPSVPPKKEQKKSNTMLWVLGGALLVGAVVATGGGGGSAGSDSGNTGTVTFSGATP